MNDLTTKRAVKTLHPISIRLEREEVEGLEKVSLKYPVPNRNDMVRAAVRLWTSLAEHGLDANLQPLRKGS